MTDLRDLRDLQRLVQDVWAERKPFVEAHVGDLAWWSRETDCRARAWRSGGAVAAWGWFSPPGELDCLVRPGHEGLLPEVLDWFEDEARGAERREVWVLEGDEPRVEELLRRGYARDEGPYFIHLARTLEDLSRPKPTASYVIRPMTGAIDVPRRVDVQRAAFGAGSTITEQKYARIQRTWPYQPELDLVAETSDGRFGGFCTCWLDGKNRTGEFEPVGTHPEHERRGLATAVCLSGLWALRQAGADTAIVHARGDSAYPAPLKLYTSLGFEPVGRMHRYVGALGRLSAPTDG